MALTRAPTLQRIFESMNSLPGKNKNKRTLTLNLNRIIVTASDEFVARKLLSVVSLSLHHMVEPFCCHRVCFDMVVTRKLLSAVSLSLRQIIWWDLSA
jgi:GTP cyclohydrolase I